MTDQSQPNQDIKMFFMNKKVGVSAERLSRIAQLVTARPGMTATEIIAETKMVPSGVYAAIRALVDEGVIKAGNTRVVNYSNRAPSHSTEFIPGDGKPVKPQKPTANPLGETLARAQKAAKRIAVQAKGRDTQAELDALAASHDDLASKVTALQQAIDALSGAVLG